MIKNKIAHRAVMMIFALVVLAAGAANAQTTIQAFTGGDAGEGLDLDGNFLYAVNVRGPAAGAVRDATFTDDTAAGVTVTAANEILNWTNPDYGATANDDNLEVVMQSIRWNGFPNTVDVDLANLIPGDWYTLQLLFAEQCCTRGFNITVEGTLIANEFAPFQTQAGTNTTAQDDGAVVRYTFMATDDTLNIVLGGTNTVFSDDNPILNGVTLEAVVPGTQIPTLSEWAMILMALLLAAAGFVAIKP